MRNASICVVNLRGVATELIKNLVLAGIGELIILDSENVQEEDLGAGFFFRENDVGKKVRLPPHVSEDDHKFSLNESVSM